MKSSKEFLIIILLFPLFVATMGWLSLDRYANILFLGFFSLYVLWTSYKYQSSFFYVKRSQLADYLLFLVSFSIVIVNYSGFENIFPLLFFGFLFLLFHVINCATELKIPYRFVEFIILFYLLLSFTCLFFTSSFKLEGRFQGFAPSATTYSIYMIGIAVVAFNLLKSYYQKLFFFIVVFVFVLLTKTRLNLAYLLLVPIFYFVSNLSTKSKFYFLLLFLLLLIAIYPIYDWIILKYPNLIQFRYSDGRDASFGLRYVLFSTVKNEFLSLDILKMLFGNGWESSRLLISNNFGYDHMPHNDFIRLLYDFGILGTATIILTISRISLKNPISYQLGILYLFSFYHNMIYNFFIIGLLIVFSRKIDK